jgi:hypothetical protein
MSAHTKVAVKVQDPTTMTPPPHRPAAENITKLLERVSFGNCKLSVSDLNMLVPEYGETH